mmetsp:Transcript_44771/g.106284  ORF Transcript_44771/g.106284 Transcript_44771/m.106284 type:complete len:263 (-) Transcript_44771:121-909(-)
MHYVGEAGKAVGKGLSALGGVLSEPVKSLNDTAKHAVELVKAVSFDWHELLPASMVKSFHEPLGSYVVYALVLNIVSVGADVYGIAMESVHACKVAALFCIVNIVFAVAHIGFALRMQKQVLLPNNTMNDLDQPLLDPNAEVLSGVLVEGFKNFIMYDISVLAYLFGAILCFLFNINFVLQGAAGCADEAHIGLKLSGNLQTLFPMIAVLLLFCWFFAHELDACCCKGKLIPWCVRRKHAGDGQESQAGQAAVASAVPASKV